MRMDNVAAASARFMWEYIKSDRIYVPVAPEDPRPVHAVRMYSPGAAQASSLDRHFAGTRELLVRAASGNEPFIDEGWGARFEAACGARVKVVWPGRFNDADPDRCSRCTDDLVLERVDFAEWQRQRHERAEYRQRRAQEREERREWQELQRQAEWEADHPKGEEPE